MASGPSAQEKEDNEFLFNIVFALAMVYFLMASLFESISHPFSIMLSLPFAMVGVVWHAAAHRHAEQPDGEDRTDGAGRRRGQ